MSYGIYKQLLKRENSYKTKTGYLQQGFYDEGYAVGPDYPHEADTGVISNLDNGDLYFFQCPKRFSNDESRNKAIKEFEMFAKLVVARNFQICKMKNWASEESSV